MTDAEQAELDRRFEELGRDVAAALDTAETMEPGWWHQVDRWVYGAVTLYHPTGLALRLEHKSSTDANRGRLTVRGINPQGWTGDAVYSIGVSAGRAPDDLARDIRRRLLPDYAAALPGMQADVASDQRRRAARKEAMRSLVAALPALHPYQWDQEQSAGSFHSDTYHCPERAHASGTVHVNAGGKSANLKINSVSVPLARAILALLRLPPAKAPE
ncbi:hypothetical protein [Kitasatospora sp. NPDC127060]|uniref:hypothetical protein n=1 Tax=Kitasatospora sp. NPDC127060 TaxID=3347121 RepID=UPI00364E852C